MTADDMGEEIKVEYLKEIAFYEQMWQIQPWEYEDDE
jgi:hypothetical protein